MAKRNSKSSPPEGYRNALDSFMNDLAEQSQPFAQAASQILQISSAYGKTSCSIEWGIPFSGGFGTGWRGHAV
jgi:hypothetical protein